MSTAGNVSRAFLQAAGPQLQAVTYLHDAQSEFTIEAGKTVSKENSSEWRSGEDTTCYSLYFLLFYTSLRNKLVCVLLSIVSPRAALGLCVRRGPGQML